ncbi:hypothetical protein [Halorientalis salina]|uniref:hypothetical protein n=1 Tax=Halorientalis salina TaxID=2932266 RepID=UPI0010ACC910|nr:hypothetical protein [Halorientalis salina]
MGQVRRHDVNPGRFVPGASVVLGGLDGGCSAELSPMGAAQFEGVPDGAVAFDAARADGLVGLGQGDAALSLGHQASFHGGYYEQSGEWPGIGTHGERERLFDRRRLADSIEGGV